MSITVVRTLDIRIVLQIAVQKGGNLCICITTCATIQLDTGFRKCILRTASDTAADQCIHLICFQQGDQRTVAVTIGVQESGCCDFLICCLLYTSPSPRD